MIINYIRKSDEKALFFLGIAFLFTKAEITKIIFLGVCVIELVWRLTLKISTETKNLAHKIIQVFNFSSENASKLNKNM